MSFGYNVKIPQVWYQTKWYTYSKTFQGVQTACLTSHFFAWPGLNGWMDLNCDVNLMHWGIGEAMAQCIGLHDPYGPEKVGKTTNFPNFNIFQSEVSKFPSLSLVKIACCRLDRFCLLLNLMKSQKNGLDSTWINVIMVQECVHFVDL